MAGDDLLDAYIAEALASTGTRKAQPPDPKPAVVARPAPANPVLGRSAAAQPHSVPARTSSQTRPPIPASPAPAVARARDLDTIEPLPRRRAPQGSSSPSSPIQNAFDSEFGEDTVPEAQAISALTDQDDRGVRRS
jgi:hypothetical protein